MNLVGAVGEIRKGHSMCCTLAKRHHKYSPAVGIGDLEAHCAERSRVLQEFIHTPEHLFQERAQVWKLNPVCIFDDTVVISNMEIVDVH